MLFSEVVGQEEIKEKLRKSIQAGRIPHAQIFYGPDGSGTLPLAIAYAQYIACTARNFSDACGSCASCRKMQKLAHPDLHFTFPTNSGKKVTKDAVSDDYIGEWREFVLKDPYFRANEWYNYIGLENKQGLINKKDSELIIRKLGMKSFESDYKFMIIWLPEKMNAASSNILLKLIEEPPENTVFLLVSEDPGQVLPTISSRTQPVKLSPIKKEALEVGLKQRFRLREEELAGIVRLAQGSYTRAVEVIQTSEENELNLQKFADIMRFCYARSFFEVNAWVDEMASSGRERLKGFFEFSLRMIRESFIQNIQQPELLYMTPDEAEFSERFHPYVNGNNVVSLYNELTNASADIERNGYARIILFDLTLRIMKLIQPKR
jgi:DNA polymerase-3 subunit delta'